MIQALLRDHSRGDRVLSIGSWSSLKKLKGSLEAVLQLVLPSGYGRRIVDQALDTEDDDEDLYFDESFMSEVVPLLEENSQENSSKNHVHDFFFITARFGLMQPKISEKIFFFSLPLHALFAFAH